MLDFIGFRILPTIVYINLVTILIIIFFKRKQLSGYFSKISTKTWIILLIITLLAAFFRFILVNYAHLWFIDETWYMTAARNLANSFEARVFEGVYSKPLGWPIILSFSFLVFGINNYVAILTSAAIGTLSTPLVFLLSYLIFKSEKVALFSALLLALFPLHILYSWTAEAAVPSLFFFILCLIFFFIFLEQKEFSNALLFTLSFTFLLFFRVENILLAIPLFFLVRKNIKKLVLPFIISVPFIISYFAQYVLLRSLYARLYTQSVNLFGFQLISPKLLSLINYSLAPFMVAFIILAILGIFYSRKNSLFFSSGFFVFLCFCLIYLFSANFHLLPGWLFLLFPASFSASKLHFKFVFAILLLVLLALQFPTYPHHNLYSLQTAVIMPIAYEIPEECYLVSENPNIYYSVKDLKAVRTFDFLWDSNLLQIPDGRNNCFYFVEDIYCKHDLFNSTIARCSKIKNSFVLEDIRKFSGFGHEFVLYRI